MTQQHCAIYINNQSNKQGFIDRLFHDAVLPLGFEMLIGLQGALFSKLALNQFIDEEERHDEKTITKDTPQSLKSMSSGERKKALLKHLLKTNPDFLILDNPFDNLDSDSQNNLTSLLNTISTHTTIVQLISRKGDLLTFIANYATLVGSTITFHNNTTSIVNSNQGAYPTTFNAPIPLPLVSFSYPADILIILKNVSVKYGDKPILNKICWEIRPGEFWQLIGKNGSGKSTLLSMITGENSKGYGQELYIFGQKKGSGESIWEIKEKIGYFTPAMTDKFSGHHTVEHMMISGFNDSVGLYQKPTDVQLALAKEWLLLIGMWPTKDIYFHDLSIGQQRLVMTIRAMIKHPPLLILDEPTAGLDDQSASLFVTLANKIAKESKTAIVFVSHRPEPGLTPDFVYTLEMAKTGSTGKVLQQ